MRLFSFLLDRIYPPTCLACRAGVEEAGTLCPACWRAMPFIERPFCERLGTPFIRDLGPGLLSPEDQTAQSNEMRLAVTLGCLVHCSRHTVRLFEHTVIAAMPQ